MNEDVIIHPNENTKDLLNKNHHPYSVYYKISSITYIIRSQSNMTINDSILKLMIDDEQKTNKSDEIKTQKRGVSSRKNKTQKKKNGLINIVIYGFDIEYNSHPEKYYETLERLKASNESYLQTSNKRKIKLSKEDYININNKWGEFYGLQKISGYKELFKRRLR